MWFHLSLVQNFIAGMDAGLRPKGGGRMPLFPLLSAFGGEMDFATGKIQCLNPPRMAGMDAGYNGLLKNGTEAIFEQRKG
jgi:hypothetical protein